MSWRPTPRFGALIATALFVQVTSGCLSNEYVIPASELQRLAAMPPEARGAHVRTVQQLGDRRADAVEPPTAVPPSLAQQEELPPDDYGSGQVDVGIHIDGGGGGGWDGGPRAPRPSASAGGWRGTPVGGG